MIKHRPVCDPVRHSFSQFIYVLFVWIKVRRVLQIKHDDGITAHEMVVPRVMVGRLDAQLEHCPHRGLDHALEGWLAEMLGLRCVQRCVADIREEEGPDTVAGAFAVEDGDGVALERRELLVDCFSSSNSVSHVGLSFLIITVGGRNGPGMSACILFRTKTGNQLAAQLMAISKRERRMCKRRTWL